MSAQVSFSSSKESSLLLTSESNDLFPLNQLRLSFFPQNLIDFHLITLVADIKTKNVIRVHKLSQRNDMGALGYCGLAHMLIYYEQTNMHKLLVCKTGD